MQGHARDSRCKRPSVRVRAAGCAQGGRRTEVICAVGTFSRPPATRPPAPVAEMLS